MKTLPAGWPPSWLILLILLIWLLSCPAAIIAADDVKPRPWSLAPLNEVEVPRDVTISTNPIDAFMAADQKVRGLRPASPAGKLVLLRRVTFDLTGLPPTPDEQQSFLADGSPEAYEKVVDRLLSSEQHGVRYARHWLDVLRYADVDEKMPASPGIHHWRDWVIDALNDDIPYDQFVRAQLTGYRSTVRTEMSATGVRSRKEPRPDDLFALGFLSRGAVKRNGDVDHEFSMSAVETASAAFMGMTVGCAKCHDHFYDPISQRDFYAMKAVFDSLVLRKVTLAAPPDLIAAGRARAIARKEQDAIDEQVELLTGEFRRVLFDERVAALPADVQHVIRKPDESRTAAEQKIADDYFPILRIDVGKLLGVMPPDKRSAYNELQKRRGQIQKGETLPAFWTVESQPGKPPQPTYVLTSGDPERPQMDQPVSPGWPFAPEGFEIRETPVDAFSDWLTSPRNPLFARVAVNRVWQWHFGTGLHQSPSDFGNLVEPPAHRSLLDWLAAEFVRRGFKIKELHRLIVTSDTYKLASDVSPGLAAANLAIDPANASLWRFPLRRLEAESIWDAIWTSAGKLDVSSPRHRAGNSDQKARGVFLPRGYSASREVMPSILTTFDVDDGRAPCPMRTSTVTAPQALYLTNSEEIQQASRSFADRLAAESSGRFDVAVDAAFRVALGRPASAAERKSVEDSLAHDPKGLEKLAWAMFNLDEFLYVP